MNVQMSHNYRYSRNDKEFSEKGRGFQEPLPFLPSSFKNLNNFNIFSEILDSTRLLSNNIWYSYKIRKVYVVQRVPQEKAL